MARPTPRPGPQAGLGVGRRPVVDAMRRNPLYRALRVDKMSIAARDPGRARGRPDICFGGGRPEKVDHECYAK
ncbi:MAG TPA: hypothetical protein VGJ46_04275 [Candidatus Limnocylindrales bacterium]